MLDKLNISLEPHLRDALETVLRILPEETSQKLTLCLSPKTDVTLPPVISYQLILEISKWCQTTHGKAALQSRSPPLDPQSFTMVSLLAGTRTSPEKHFPPYAAKDPEGEQHLQTKDRKALATLVNAVLSVIGTGVTTWWAGEHTGMQLEWRALLAVCAALVVAFAEVVLYVIWDSQQTSRPHRRTRPAAVVQHKDIILESSSDANTVTRVSGTTTGDTNLRHRTTVSTTVTES